jgi:Zn-dependent protease
MIPIPPLDGGNIAIGLLPPAVAGGLIRLQPFGILLLYALMLSGALAAIIRPVIVFLQWLLFA